jgi:hypothetical protein
MRVPWFGIFMCYTFFFYIRFLGLTKFGLVLCVHWLHRSECPVWCKKLSHRLNLYEYYPDCIINMSCPWTSKILVTHKHWPPCMMKFNDSTLYVNVSVRIRYTVIHKIYWIWKNSYSWSIMYQLHFEGKKSDSNRCQGQTNGIALTPGASTFSSRTGKMQVRFLPSSGVKSISS